MAQENQPQPAEAPQDWHPLSHMLLIYGRGSFCLVLLFIAYAAYVFLGIDLDAPEGFSPTAEIVRIVLSAPTVNLFLFMGGAAVVAGTAAAMRPPEARESWGVAVGRGVAVTLGVLVLFVFLQRSIHIAEAEAYLDQSAGGAPPPAGWIFDIMIAGASPFVLLLSWAIHRWLLARRTRATPMTWRWAEVWWGIMIAQSAWSYFVILFTTVYWHSASEPSTGLSVQTLYFVIYAMSFGVLVWLRARRASFAVLVVGVLAFTLIDLTLFLIFRHVSVPAYIIAVVLNRTFLALGLWLIPIIYRRALAHRNRQFGIDAAARALS